MKPIVLHGDALEMLGTLPDESVQMCVTSPPYWGLRDYGVAGQLGMEKTPQEFVGNMVAVFREVRRVLKNDGTLWMNLGDTYAGGNGGGGSFAKDGIRCAEPGTDKNKATRFGARGALNGIKPKDLIGIPWEVAFALRADGWYLRSDIIWQKPNPMPESVTDRPTKAHEYLFLLSKSGSYFYDADAIREPAAEPERERLDRIGGSNGHTVRHSRGGMMEGSETRNKRTVWTIPTTPYPEAHFATYPPDLIKPCILAGSKPGDVVLDPFGGSGTTGQVTIELGRKAILIELNPAYLPLIESRCNVTPGLAL